MNLVLQKEKNFFKIPLKSIFPYISEKTIIYIRDFGSGPGLGLDWNKASLGHFLTVIGFGINKNAKWKVLNQPTNEGWIDIWEQYLKKGVKIIKNHQLEFINIHNKNNTVKNLVIKNLNNNKIFNINGNYYIIASDPFSYQTILQKTLYNSKKNNINKKINIELTKLNKLNLINNQIGFVIGFNKKFNYKNNNDCFVLLDSPNNITFYPQDLHFCKNTNLGKNIKSLWSGTCVISYNKGLLYNKTLTELDLPKLKEEILSQLFSSNDLKWYISKNNKGHKLQKKDVEIIEIFNDWKYNKKNKKLVSNNPKWVNTFFNEQYRPSQKSFLNNLYIAGAHTKTSINVWSMEGAIESGKIISNNILEKNNFRKIYLYKHDGLAIFKPFRILDSLTYKLNLPNINIITLLILIVIIYIIKKKK